MRSGGGKAVEIGGGKGCLLGWISDSGLSHPLYWIAIEAGCLKKTPNELKIHDGGVFERRHQY